MIGQEPRDRAPKDYLVREKVWEIGETLAAIDPATLPAQLPDSISSWVTSEYPGDEAAMNMARQAWNDFKDREAGNF